MARTAVAFFVLLLIAPDSPRWLALKGRIAEAIGATNLVAAVIGISGYFDSA